MVADPAQTVALPGQQQAFTIGELGFGSGLNFLQVWKLWCESGRRPRMGLWGRRFVYPHLSPVAHTVGPGYLLGRDRQGLPPRSIRDAGGRDR